MKKMAKFAISFLTLSVLFSIVLGSSATAQGPIAVAILHEDENAPQWNPANNDGSTFPFAGPGSLYDIAQGFGTRIERGTRLFGNVGGLITGDVEIVASSIVRRSGSSEVADLGTGAAFGSISVITIQGGQLDGRFAGRIDLSRVDLMALGFINGHYHLNGGELRLNGELGGIFIFPYPAVPDPLSCDPLQTTCYVYLWDNDINFNPTPLIYPDEYDLSFTSMGYPPLPRVKLIALLFD